MDWVQLSDRERRIMRAIGVAAIVILLGLTITGVWQFIYHEHDPNWLRYRPGSNDSYGSAESTGMASAHGAFGDAGAIFSLGATAWISVKVLYRVSRIGLAAFLVSVFGLITGGMIRFNAVRRNGSFDEESTGYTQIFRGDVDFMLTDRFEMGPLTAQVLTALHVLSVPVLVGAAWYVLRRPVEHEPNDASWLDRLDSSQPEQTPR